MENELEQLLSASPFVYIPTFIVVALVLSRFSFVRRLFLWAVTLPAAFVLLITWAWSLVVWKPASFLATKLTHLLKLSELADWLIGERNESSSFPLCRGEREVVAKGLWPPEKFPFLYTKDIPSDIVRPLYEDGRLIGGYSIDLLADRHFNMNALNHAIRAGLTVAILAASLPLIAAILFYLVPLLFNGMGGYDIPSVKLESWPSGGLEILAPSSWWLGDLMEHIGENVKTFVLDVLIFVLSLAAFAVGCFSLMSFIVLNQWQKEKARPYEVMTKDARVRWPYRAETRKLYNVAYNRQCELATGYLKDAPLFQIGKATGLFRTRGDLTAPTENQGIFLDAEGLFQHLLVLGGTGEGKTTAVLKPLMRQIMAMNHVGVYVCDAKGVLWHDALEIAEKAGRGEDVVVIGTGEGQYGVDPLAYLSPTQVSSVFRSILRQITQGARDSFWPDMATNVLRNVLTIAEAYIQTDEGLAEIENGIHPYSLWWAYQTVINEDKLFQAIERIKDKAASLRENLAQSKNEKQEEERYSACMAFNTVERTSSIEYLETTWKNMAPATKSGIIASLSQILDGFGGSERLRERFACGRQEGTIDLSAALDGKLVLNALSNLEDGLTARLVSILLKTALYRQARLRESQFKTMIPPQSPQDTPCVIIMDEVQEIVTADPTSGLSDATFWNVARSAGVAGIFATQTIAALKQALGNEASNNFIQQARSKIFLRSEDQETVNYAIWCAGTSERGRVYDEGQRESIEFRHLIDGWEPFAPLDPNDTIAVSPSSFLSIAKTLLFPESVGLPFAETDTSFYKPDMRFIPTETFSNGSGNNAGLNQSHYHARMGALQASHWRAEDLERQMRSHGNELCPLLTTADLFNMGRWHAFVHIQRAGLARQDIIAIEHDFS